MNELRLTRSHHRQRAYSGIAREDRVIRTFASARAGFCGTDTERTEVAAE